MELVASGRTAAELSREFGASAQSIGEWAKKAGAASSWPRAAAILAAHRQAMAVANKTALTADERGEGERLRKENKRLQLERDILANGFDYRAAWFARISTHLQRLVYHHNQVIRANQAAAVDHDSEHYNAERAQRCSIKTISRVLGVSRSGYHDWSMREPAPCTRENAALTERIKAIHMMIDEIYGAPKIHAELCDTEIATHDPRSATVRANGVARLMPASGLRGVSRRRNFTVTTERNKKDCPAPDSVKREFVADGPNKLWVADITHVLTWVGSINLAVVINAWSRRVVGWQIGQQMKADLVINSNHRECLCDLASTRLRFNCQRHKSNTHGGNAWLRSSFVQAHQKDLCITANFRAKRLGESCVNILRGFRALFALCERIKLGLTTLLLSSPLISLAAHGPIPRPQVANRFC